MISKKMGMDPGSHEGWTIDTSVVGEMDFSSATVFSPLGAGIMSMTPTPTSVHARHSSQWKEEEEKNEENQDSVRARAGPRTPTTTTALTASTVTRGFQTSTMKPLSASEKKICLESWSDKYEEQGYFPIREAIDIYHSVSTGHVNFSKVWMLVDPESVCKIDKEHFCAFIAVVNCILEQGESVRLPGKTLSEGEIRWLAGADLTGGAKDGKAVVHREVEAFYDVPLESSWRTDVREDGEGKSTPKPKTWSLGKRFVKFSLRRKKKEGEGEGEGEEGQF